MRLPFRMRLTVAYTLLLVLFGALLIMMVAVVVNRLLDASSLQEIPAALRGRSVAELRAIDFVDIVREARLAERDQIRRAVVRVVFVTFLVLIIAGAAVAWMLAGRMIRPLRQVTAHARSASATTLSNRMTLGGPNDELHDLMETYNELLSRLDEAFAAQRHFAANVSHELRTPLAIVRAEADVLLASPDLSARERQFATSVQGAVVRGESLIDALLLFSRAEHRLLDDDVVDLATIVGDVAGELATDAGMAGVQLDLTLGEARLRGDEVLMSRMVRNVVHNAIHHNLPGGWVRISVTSTHDHVVLMVVNSGPVVGEPESMFVPFQTGGGAGIGLGLAIVREVVMAHDGAVTVDARAQGGLALTIELPIAR